MIEKTPYNKLEQNLHIDMEIKIGEKYELKQDSEYFCIPIQRSVKFTSPVYVEAMCKSTIHYIDPVSGTVSVYFGKLIDSGGFGSPDYVTEKVIEFNEEDVIGTYTMKIMLLFYMDGDINTLISFETKNDKDQ